MVASLPLRRDLFLNRMRAATGWPFIVPTEGTKNAFEIPGVAKFKVTTDRSYERTIKTVRELSDDGIGAVIYSSSIGGSKKAIVMMPVASLEELMRVYVENVVMPRHREGE